jgi:large subunit ribosomal protein L32e
MAKEDVKKPETKKKTIDKPKEKTQAKKQTATKTSAQKKTTGKPFKETKKEEKPVKKETTKPEIKEKIEEKKVIKPKKKPVLTEELKQQLEKRKEIKKRTPEFLREEWFRYKRIPKNWRRPDGITSKMRRNLAYRPSKVRVGFRGPKQARGLHSSGFEEVTVFNVKDLETLNPKTQAARIGGSVGTKKRIDIGKKAEELDIRLLNL